MYLALNLRNRILHFTIIGLIFLSFYTYYYAATNEIRQLSVPNTASSQSSSGVIRSILSTKREIQGTQSLPKNATSESLISNVSPQYVNGASNFTNSNNADKSTSTSNVNFSNNSSNRNGASGSSYTSDGSGGGSGSSSSNANDMKNENAAANGENDVNIANNANNENNANNPLPISTVLTSQPLAPPSLAKQIEETAVEKVEKKETKESKPVVPKKVKPDSAGAFYIPGHTVAIPEKCLDHGANLSLLILIASAPPNFEARMAIRHTWGHFDQRKDVSIAFLLGESSDPKIDNALKQESQMYADVIHGRFIDSYSNLTLKTISALDWVINYCAEVKFVLKTDDDMFINVPRLLSFIRSHWKDKNVIFGRLARRWKPIRSVKSKYYVSPKQFRPATFPDFTTGPAYLFSSDIAPKLYAKALEQTYLKLEDVFTTGIVAHYLNIKRIQANEFLNKRIAFSPCNVQKSISIHMVKYSEQFDLWKKLLDGKSTCK